VYFPQGNVREKPGVITRERGEISTRILSGSIMDFGDIRRGGGLFAQG